MFSTNQTTQELFKAYKASQRDNTGLAFMANYIAQTAKTPARAFYNYLASEGLIVINGKRVFYEHVSAFIYGIKDSLDAQAVEGN